MKPYAIDIKWGFIFSLALLVWAALERLVGLHDQYISVHPYYTNIFALVAILIYVLAMRDKRQNYYAGEMNWLQGFVTGAIIAGVVAALSPLTQLITHEIITPHYFQNAIKHSIATEILTQPKAEANFNLKSYIIQSIVDAITTGVVTAAVVAIFMRKKAKN